MKKLIVIALVALLLLGGGGGAYWWFMLRGAAEDVAEEAEEAPPPAPVYVDLAPLTVPVIRGGAVKRYVLLKVTLEVADEAAKATVEERMPLVMDRCLRALHKHFASIPVDAPLNVRTVKKRLRAAAGEVVAPALIEAVLIQGAFEKTG